MFIRRFVAACLALYGLPGCQVLFGYEDFERGLPGAESCTAAEDPGRNGPPMAKVTRADGSCFWIDTTEVTAADYAEFLLGAPSSQAGSCSWNTMLDDGAAPEARGFEPDEACTQMVQTSDAGDAGNGASDRLPITCIDWCDALAFCEWAGKELCADRAGAVPSIADSDWLVACSGAAGTRLYGCEGGCGASACNGSSAAVGLAPAGSFPDCAVSAGQRSIFDLSGNAAEWTASCNDDTESGSCMLRGGAHDTDDSALECRNWSEAPRSRVRPTLGFRCCAGAN